MKFIRTAAWLAVICIAAGAGGWWAARYLLPAEKSAALPAPDLTLNDLDGRPHRLSEWRGKLLLVNFWAPWCAPCVDEMPLLVEAQKQYGARGLQIIGPAMDDPAAVKQMAAKLGVTYPIMADFAQVDAAMQALGNTQGALPFSVFISPDGLVVETVLGALHKNDLKRLLEIHLGHSTPAS